MEEAIPGSNGIFPEVNDWEVIDEAVPEVEHMKDIQNYVPVTDQPDEAEIVIDR